MEARFDSWGRRERKRDRESERGTRGVKGRSQGFRWVTEMGLMPSPLFKLSSVLRS